MAEFNFTTVGVDTLNAFTGSGPVARFSHGQVFHVGPNFAASKLQQLIDATTVEEQYQIIESEARWGYDLVNLPIIISGAVAGTPPANPPAITSTQARKGLNLNSVGNDYTQAINLNATGIKQGIHNVKYNMQIPAQQGEYMFNLVVLYNTIGVANPDNEEQMPIAAVYLFDSAVKKLAGQGTISIDVILRYVNGVSIDAIEWVVPVAEYANLIQMDSVNSLPPVSSFVGSKNNHAYLVNGLDGLDPTDPTVFYGRDLNGRSFIAKSEGESLYSFSSHCRDVAKDIVISSTGGPDGNGNYWIVYDDSALAEPLGASYDTTKQGRYILQFTDGASKGLCRSVTVVDTTAKRIYFNDSVVGGSFGAGTFQLLIDNSDGVLNIPADVNPTPDTIPIRDGGGRLKAQDPVAAQDVVTKNYFENNTVTVNPILVELKKHAMCFPKAQATASKETFGLTLTGPVSGVQKWFGGVLGPDGKIYCVPNESPDILIIDSFNNIATLSDMGADLSGVGTWAGGVLGPDGKIYCSPSNATDILIIDPIADTATRSAMGADLTGNAKWQGGVLGTDGKIYCVPNSATDILIIDTVSGTATRSNMGADLTGGVKWKGGVLGPDGKIYCVPNYSTDILIIDPMSGTATRSNMGADLTGTLKWTGGVLGPDGKIYGMPYSATDILIIDPLNGTATRSNMGADLSGVSKWWGGVLGPDGKIYGICFGDGDFLVIDTLSGTASRTDFGLDLSSSLFYGGTVGIDGVIYCFPSTSDHLVKITNRVATAFSDTIALSPYLNKF
ncbi:MAG: hypothetical protein WC967_09295 [Balneolaceae bacterium]